MKLVAFHYSSLLALNLKTKLTDQTYFGINSCLLVGGTVASAVLVHYFSETGLGE